MDHRKLHGYVEKYKKKLKSDRKSKNTILSYNTCLNDFLSFIKDTYEGEFELKDATMDYIDSLSGELKVGSINTKRSGIRSFISFLYERDYIKEDFSHYIKNLKNNRKQIDILEPEEIKLLINYLTDELKKAKGYNIYPKARNLTLIIFMLYTATRRGEVVNVKFSDIDFINNEIRILGKGNKERIVPLRQEVKDSLYNFRDIIEKLHNADYNVKSDYVFRSERVNPQTGLKDTPMTARNVLKIVKSSCKKAGIEKNITAHSLRHIFASYAIQSNVNLRALSDILGHSNTSTTLDIYSHVISNELKKQEMNKLEY